jgi:hypothetical protein
MHLDDSVNLGLVAYSSRQAALYGAMAARAQTVWVTACVDGDKRLATPVTASELSTPSTADASATGGTGEQAGDYWDDVLQMGDDSDGES